MEIKSKIFNFNTQPSVRFANLFIIKNINELLDQNLINKKQNQFILNNLNYKKHNHPFYLSTENGDQLTIFSILNSFSASSRPALPILLLFSGFSIKS